MYLQWSMLNWVSTQYNEVYDAVWFYCGPGWQQTSAPMYCAKGTSVPMYYMRFSGFWWQISLSNADSWNGIYVAYFAAPDILSVTTTGANPLVYIALMSKMRTTMNYIPTVPGRYASGSGMTTATQASPGYYAPGGGSSQLICGVGTYSTAASSSCIQCAAGTYATGSGSAGSCTISPPGYYVPVVGTNRRITCGVGTYSGTGASVCSLCPAGTYNTGVGIPDSPGCPLVSAGYYASGIGYEYPPMCGFGTYSSAGATACSLCPPAYYNRYSYNTNCPLYCAPGTFGAVYGATNCPSVCPAGTYGTATAATSQATACPSQCPAGRWGTSTAQTSLSGACPSLCPAGSWGTAAGATSQAAACPGLCPAGTYGTALGATSQGAACPSQCAAGTYGASVGSGSQGAACQNTCAAGTWGSGAGMTSASAACPNVCPAGLYGSTALVGAGSQAAACPYPCPMATWGTLTGQVVRGLACPYICPMGTWGNVTGAASVGAACGYTCPPGLYGISTGATSQAAACSACFPCYPGTFTITSCVTGSQTACGYSNAPNYYSRGGAMVSYTQGVSPPLVGARPVVITINNVLTYTRYILPSFVVAPGGASSRLQTSPNTFSIPVMLPCPTPPSDRVFRQWSPAPLPVSLLSDLDAGAAYTAACDLLSSTQCAGFTGSGGGYFTASADGSSCAPCTIAAAYPTCGWGMYGNISACSASSNTTCAPCYGSSKPANAVWVAPQAPFYFTGVPRCSWVCNVGYYLNASGDGCSACFLPTGGTFKPGNILGRNAVSLGAPGVSDRLFGGSATDGCGIDCAPGYVLTLTHIGQQTFDPSLVTCDACTVPTCGLGFVAQGNANNCLQCNACPSLPEFASYVAAGSCTVQCNAGYYASYGGTCVPCSAPTCGAQQYTRECTPVADAACVGCTSSCLAAQYTSSACNATADLRCQPCSSSAVANGQVGSECQVACNINYALNNTLGSTADAGATCVPCVVDASRCAADQQAVSCDLQNLGCRPCAQPSRTGIWCWSGFPPGACSTVALSDSVSSAVVLSTCKKLPTQFQYLLGTGRTTATATVAVVGGASTSSSPTTPPPPPTTTTATTIAVVKTTTAAATQQASSATATTTAATGNVTTASPSIITSSSSSSSSSSRSSSSSSSSSSAPSSVFMTTTTTRTTAAVVTTSGVIIITTTAAAMTTTTTAATTIKQVTLTLTAIQFTNATVQSMLCLSPRISSAMTTAFGPNATGIVAIQNSTVTVDCPNFVCPTTACAGGGSARRRLLLLTSSTPPHTTTPQPQSSSAVEIVVQSNWNLTLANATSALQQAGLLSVLHLQGVVYIMQRSVDAAAAYIWTSVTIWLTAAGASAEAAVSSSLVVIIAITAVCVVLVLAGLGLVAWLQPGLFGFGEYTAAPIMARTTTTANSRMHDCFASLSYVDQRA
jgi:hypothetical protein